MSRMLPMSSREMWAGSSFLASGAGAVPRPIADILGEFVNVKSYGAKGDGVTDDVPAIRLAEAAVEVSGGVLFFPRGIYCLKTWTDIGNNLQYMLAITGSNVMWDFADGAELKIAPIGNPAGLRPIIVFGHGKGGRDLANYQSYETLDATVHSLALSNTFTADASTDIIAFATDFGVNAAVTFNTTGTLPAPLATGTTYYLLRQSATTAKVALTQGGSAINITDTGSGAHTIVGQVAKATCVLPALSNAGDAASYAVGDIIYLRTGSTLNNAAISPDCELNKVEAINGGVITLKWPTTKPYAQEYYPSGSSGISSRTGGGNAAPCGIANVNDRVIENIIIRGLKYEGSSSGNGDLQAISLWSVLNAKLIGCNITYNKNGLGSRDARHVDIIDITWEHLGTFISNASYFVGPSTGCSDWRILNFRTNSPTVSYLHLHEGVANIEIGDFRIRNGDSAGQVTGMVDMTTRTYDINMHDGSIDFAGTGTNPMINIDAACGGGGRIRNIKITRQASAANDVRCDAGGWEIENVTCNGQLAQISLRALQDLNGAAGSKTDVWAQVGALTSAKLTCKFGIIPTYGGSWRLLIDKQTGFNSDGTDYLNVGYVGALSAYVSNLDVSGTGAVEIDLSHASKGTSLGRQEGAPRELIATVTPGGSAPSTGALTLTMFSTVMARPT
ncbi:MAG: glycosyl hydrolase family 28-related protein [Geminicoccaceae bacterium]